MATQAPQLYHSYLLLQTSRQTRPHLSTILLTRPPTIPISPISIHLHLQSPQPLFLQQNIPVVPHLSSLSQRPLLSRWPAHLPQYHAQDHLPALIPTFRDQRACTLGHLHLRAVLPHRIDWPCRRLLLHQYRHHPRNNLKPPCCRTLHHIKSYSAPLLPHKQPSRSVLPGR